MPEFRQRWLSVEQTGKRLGLGRWATLNAVRSGTIPHLPMGPHDKIYKIPVDAPGRLLASAYECWPPEDRPLYTLEEFETLSAISIDELALQLGWKRSATYDRVKAGRIPRIKIGERYCVPNDVAQRLHDYAYKHSTGLLELKVHPSRNSRDIPAN
jgi:excisionase family DNA binding protein